MKAGGCSGFTLIELMITTLFIGLICATVMPSFVMARIKAKETEVKKNVHEIQMALERYGTDHQKNYPAMIWGGDKKGWTPQKGYGCRTMWEHEPFNGENEENAQPPYDPLILGGYLESYPRNPFMNYQEGLSTTVTWTGPSGAGPGDGDVRFGFNGDKMGNILEDSRYLWNDYGKPTRVKNTFPDKALENNSGMINTELPGNPFYAMGGVPPWPEIAGSTVKTYHPDRCGCVSTYWPGEFFYRAQGTFDFPSEFLIIKSTVEDPKLKYVWQFKYKDIHSYVIGGFGHLNTKGMDMIRLTDEFGCPVNNINGCCEKSFYKEHPNFPRTLTTPVHFSSPEIEGGGNWGVMPIFPNIDPESRNTIWGAADGFRDGVVFATTQNAAMVLEWDKKKGVQRIK